MAKKATPPKKDTWAGTAEEWSRRAGPHNVTLSSGQQVTFRILGLQSLVRLDGLPDDLTAAVALHVANLERGGLSAVIGEHMEKAISDPAEAEKALALTKQLGDLTVELVAAALVEPKMSAAQLRDPDLVPEGDLEDLMRLCTGRVNFDSRGVRIGVEPISSAATFRHHHGCGEDCEGCKAALAELSSLDLGDL